VPVDSGASVPGRREDGRPADDVPLRLSSPFRRRSPAWPAISVPSGLTAGRLPLGHPDPRAEVRGGESLRPRRARSRSARDPR
jgi:hypothetical protein